MDINKCKNCKLYKLDTLTDGEKEHYCYPPIFPGIIAWTIPCKNRKPEDCKEILDMCDKFYGKHNKGCEE